MPQTVHAIYKTHLDMGYTDYASNIVKRYYEEYFPAAIKVARRLREMGRPERFIWTTGSWLIYDYLEQASPQQRKEMEQAIADGDITWHALPFTMHIELMNRSLLEFALGISKKLDGRFGHNTISAKASDIPGYTRAIVPVFAEFGIKFLHIGVNGVTPPPRGTVGLSLAPH